MRRGPIMKAIGADVAFGVTPCELAGHTLRDRHNHCVQCRSTNLAFQRRFNEEGRLYILTSKSIGRVKIGSTTRPVADRVRELRKYSYGGATDWTLSAATSRPIKNAGKAEWMTHHALEPYRRPAAFLRYGLSVCAVELFEVDPEVAQTELAKAIVRSSREGQVAPDGIAKPSGRLP